jgi:hypothetical protein
MFPTKKYPKLLADFGSTIVFAISSCNQYDITSYKDIGVYCPIKSATGVSRLTATAQGGRG